MLTEKDLRRARAIGLTLKERQWLVRREICRPCKYVYDIERDWRVVCLHWKADKRSECRKSNGEGHLAAYTLDSDFADAAEFNARVAVKMAEWVEKGVKSWQCPKDLNSFYCFTHGLQCVPCLIKHAQLLIETE